MYSSRRVSRAQFWAATPTACPTLCQPWGQAQPYIDPYHLPPVCSPTTPERPTLSGTMPPLAAARSIQASVYSTAQSRYFPSPVSSQALAARVVARRLTTASPRPMRSRMASPSRSPSSGLASHRVVVGASRHVVERQVVALVGPVRPLVEGPPGRPLAAVSRAADDAVLRVVVGRLRVLAEEQPGEAPGPLDVGPVGRIGHAEHVEQVVALALVEPVVARLVLPHHHGVAVSGAVPAHLLVDGVELPLAVGQEPVAAAEQVEQGPVVEALVAVVQGVDALEVGTRGPEQAAVRMGVSLEGPRRGVLDGVEEPALQHGPLRWRPGGLARFQGDCHVCSSCMTFQGPGAGSGCPTRPSTSVTKRSGCRSARPSTPPPGQWTRSESTRVREPSPKLTRRSRCDR